MRKTLFYSLIAVIVIAFASCGGPSKSFNKKYNVTESNPKTKDAIEMVKKDLSMSRPGAKIVQYTDVMDIDGEHPFHSMIVQTKENGKVDDVHYYFPADYSFVTRDLTRLSKYQLGIE